MAKRRETNRQRRKLKPKNHKRKASQKQQETCHEKVHKSIRKDHLESNRNSYLKNQLKM